MSRELGLAIRSLDSTPAEGADLPELQLHAWRGREDDAGELLRAMARLEEVLDTPPRLRLVDVHGRLLFDERLQGASRSIQLSGKTDLALVWASGAASPHVVEEAACLIELKLDLAADPVSVS